MMTTRWQVWLTSGRMCVLQDDRVIAAQLLDQPAGLDDLFRVESGGWLVEDQHVRVVEQRLGKADALFVAF